MLFHRIIPVLVLLVVSCQVSLAQEMTLEKKKSEIRNVAQNLSYASGQSDYFGEPAVQANNDNLVKYAMEVADSMGVEISADLLKPFAGDAVLSEKPIRGTSDGRVSVIKIFTKEDLNALLSFLGIEKI